METNRIDNNRLNGHLDTAPEPEEAPATHKRDISNATAVRQVRSVSPTGASASSRGTGPVS